MRKIANNGEGTTSEPVTEKKQRKKWTAEETQMLVDGCNTVSPLENPLSLFVDLKTFIVGCWQLEIDPERPKAQI